MTADQIERGLVKIAAEEKLTPQTRNKYLTAANTFGNWMLRQKRANLNPIASVDRLATPDAEHRRALDPEEAARLVAAAEAGDVMGGRTRSGKLRWQLTGPQRALLYRMAWETGLRRSTIARLTVADFDLADDPAVTVEPRVNTKTRKLQRIPLRRETAQMLAERLRGRLSGARAVDMPAKWETADMLRADLMAARAAWIALGINRPSAPQAISWPMWTPRGGGSTSMPCEPPAARGWTTRALPRAPRRRSPATPVTARCDATTTDRLDSRCATRSKRCPPHSYAPPARTTPSSTGAIQCKHLRRDATTIRTHRRNRILLNPCSVRTNAHQCDVVRRNA